MTNLYHIRVVAEGMMLIFYFGRLVALINANGAIAWRDRNYPLFLIEYLIENPTPSPEKVRLN